MTDEHGYDAQMSIAGDDRTSSRLAPLYAATCAGFIAVYCLIPAGPGADVLYSALGASCVVAILVGVRVHRPAARAPWLLMAAGQATWVCGDSIYSWLDRSGDIPLPSVADIAYLVSYPLVGYGIWLLMRAQRRTRDVAGLVDSVIVTAGFALLSWSFVAGPIVHEPTSSTLAGLVAIAYPAVDIVLLALLLRLTTGQGSWSPSFVLLVAAMVGLLSADTAFAALSAEATQSTLMDVLWLSSYVLWGAAALHPDMARLTQPVAIGRTPFTASRLALLGAVVVLPLGLLMTRDALGIDVDATLLIGASTVLSLLAIARMACDVDEIRATAAQRDDLYRRATRDPVTGLDNLPALVQQTSLALERGAREGTPSALLDIRVDGLVELSRDLGFGLRDDALRALTDRIEQVVDGGGTVARLGTGEFAVLIDRLGPGTDLSLVARQLVGALGAPLHVGSRTVSLVPAVGISVSLDGGTDPDVLLQEARLAAGTAMRTTASAEREAVEFFDASLRREHAERVDIEAALAAGIEAGELQLHYQPVVGLRDDLPDGFEALIRWDRPGHGLLLPDAFVPVAEQSDLICVLERWVIREATHQLAAWTSDDPVGNSHLTIAVNISGRHLRSSTVVDDVREALRTSGIAPARLTLEITETVLVDVPRATTHLTALRDLGVRIAIDDFGTGYTSIGQLASLPADLLKVDRSLVVSSRPGATELLALVVQAAHACDLLVVAEGVEDDDQLTTLRRLGYDLVQGFLVAEPRPAAEAFDGVTA